MSFWSWGEPAETSAALQDETQTASFWRWGEPAATVAPTQPYPVAAAATAQDERRPTFWWSEPEAPQPEERSTAVRAAGRMGLNVCGVDMLRSNHGPVIMEVNSSPGLEGIENATGKDIAGMIIEFIEKRARDGKTKTKGQG